MHAFARGAAFEEEHGVRFTTIMPGLVDTAILDQRPEPPSAELRAQMLHPEDVAAACLFAVSLPPRAHVAGAHDPAHRPAGAGPDGLRAAVVARCAAAQPTGPPSATLSVASGGPVTGARPKAATRPAP